MKKILVISFIVVMALALTVPVFANHDTDSSPPPTPNGPPTCDLGAVNGEWLIPGQGVKANIENMTGPDGENPGNGHIDPQWGYDGGPGNANVTCFFYG